MDILGVTDYVRLGGDGRFRDSGMAYSEKGHAIARDVLREGIFWTTDLLEAANELVPLIRDRRPQVLTTYNQFGGYGHPDHIQAHRVAMYAVLLAGAPAYRPDLGRGLDGAAGAVEHDEPEPDDRRHPGAARRGGHRDLQGLRPEPIGSMPLVADDDEIAAVIDGTPWVGQKLDAMRAHATQITEDGPFFAGAKVLGDSHVVRRSATCSSPGFLPAGDGWADDLFAGLD